MTDITDSSPRISVVVPVYRSEGCLAALVEAVEEALSGFAGGFELILTDDGSPDRSWDVITEQCRKHPWVRALRHRKNFGQDNALLSGLRISRGQTVVIMDDDLQHDPKDIPGLYNELTTKNLDVVYADFERRTHRTWKNMGSWLNGKVAEWLLDKPGHLYLSPYKIVRGDVARMAATYSGPYPYLDGLLLQRTNRLGRITVRHLKRYAGESSYTFAKSVHVWSRLAFSFSVKPLRVAIWFGGTLAALGALGAVLVAMLRLADPEAFSEAAVGWASLMMAILIFGGAQMIMLGIVGEYVGRTLLHVTEAPQSAIVETANITGKRDSDDVGTTG